MTSATDSLAGAGWLDRVFCEDALSATAGLARIPDGSVDLMIADPDASNARKVTALSGEYNYSDLHWSPDDQKIGFQRGRTFDYDIFFVPAVGGDIQKMTRQQKNIFLPVAQWWQDSGQYIQPVKEILPELASFDQVAQVRIGRSKDLHIDFSAFR